MKLLGLGNALYQHEGLTDDISMLDKHTHKCKGRLAATLVIHDDVFPVNKNI